MEELNIIGDIAGNFNTLMALLQKMPKSAKIMSVGDMVDRGPRSKEVLEFIMQNGIALLGNHEHMMLDVCSGSKKFYNLNIWLRNGGFSTLKSFYPQIDIFDNSQAAVASNNLKKDFFPIIDWLKQLPLYYEQQDLFISHAPLPFVSLQQATQLTPNNIDNSILWNRDDPARLENKFQIFGHNSFLGLKYYSDKQGKYAVCIDTSAQEVLTGIHWPSMEIFQQTYVD